MQDLFEADVNYLAVLLGAIAVQPLGALWYTKLFGAPWMRLRGYSESDAEGGGGAGLYLIGFVLTVIAAYGLARLSDMVGADSVGDCIAIAVFAWGCFSATTLATQINFSQTRSPALFAIEGGYWLASFVVMGAIVGAFQ
jgi:FtsH-binding integral membrane protein